MSHYLPEREADIEQQAERDEAAMKLALSQRDMKDALNDELENKL